MAYSSTFEFHDQTGGTDEIHYYFYCILYVPNVLSGQQFWLLANATSNYLDDIQVDFISKTGNGGNISLGILKHGNHLLQFELVEVAGGGWFKFYVQTSGQYAWLTRFRLYVPDYSDNEYRYTITTNTNFPNSDNYYIGGYADDFIDDLKLAGGLLWQDWEWDMGPTYGTIYSWGDGFIYPLGYLDPSGSRSVEFTFGEKQGGLLDFQMISWTYQQNKIKNPRFWASASTAEASPYVEINDAKAYTGSKWTSDPGRSVRELSTTIRVLTNSKDSNVFLPIPQEAEVSLILTWLDPLYNGGSLQIIGTIINLTYNYFIPGSVSYGMPIWFNAYSIDVCLTQQGNALQMLSKSLIFNDQSEKSFIDPAWKVVGSEAGMLINFFITAGLYRIFGPAGAIAGITTATMVSQLYNFADGQKLISVKENPGNSSFRNFAYDDWFKTAEKQEPLSPAVRSVCEGFFFSVYPNAPSHCGLISIDLKGDLYLPFFYTHPEEHGGSRGTWLPVGVELKTAFPVFITD